MNKKGCPPGRVKDSRDCQEMQSGEFCWEFFNKYMQPKIDAALAEPSDADVAEAIGSISALRKYFMPDPENVEPEHEGEYQAIANALTRIEKALRQYQKPTDEVVQRAIEFWEQSIEEDRNIATQAYMDAMTLAIQALRQMRSEQPCEITDEDVARNVEAIKKHLS